MLINPKSQAPKQHLTVIARGVSFSCHCEDCEPKAWQDVAIPEIAALRSQ